MLNLKLMYLYICIHNYGVSLINFESNRLVHFVLMRDFREFLPNEGNLQNSFEIKI